MIDPTPQSGLLQRGRRSADNAPGRRRTDDNAPGRRRTDDNAPGRRVWRLPADVDTDTLAPVLWIKYSVEVAAQHCLEHMRPQFALEVNAGDVIAAGPNFGIGSSRELAAAALVHLGVAAVIAPSFGGLFFRNAFNVGLLLLTCRDAEALADGDRVEFDAARGVLRCVATADGRDAQDRDALFECEPIPPFLLERVSAGGLLPQLKQRFQPAR
jgi:3-isopropylmalate/(R)-2-methylmalate dehydratase small subunit